MDRKIEDYLHIYSKYLHCELIRPVYAESEISTPILRHIKTITDEESQEIGYDSAGAFHKENKDYLDGIGVLRPFDFKFLIERGFDLFGLIKSGIAVDATNLKEINHG